MARLAVFYTHPIQYLAPLWRRLAAESDLDIQVHYFSDASVRGGIDVDFGVPVAWDVPLLEGYDHEFLQRDAEAPGFADARLDDPEALLERERPDAVLVGGYTHPFERQIIPVARRRGIRTLLRGELTDARRPGSSVWRRMAKSLFLRRFYRDIDAFCVLGRNGFTHLDRLCVEKDRQFSSPYSIDTGLFEGMMRGTSRAAARAELGIPEDHMVLLFSGKMIPRKEPLLLASALHRVEDPDRLHLLMLGDGPQREHVEGEIRSALGSRLSMPGFVNQTEMATYFAAADVLTLPSNYETWGLVGRQRRHDVRLARHREFRCRMSLGPRPSRSNRVGLPFWRRCGAGRVHRPGNGGARPNAPPWREGPRAHRGVLDGGQCSRRPRRGPRRSQCRCPSPAGVA